VAKAKVKKDATGLKIRAMLYERGVRFTQVAIRAGVTSSAVSRALNDNTPYIGRRIRPVIAEILGMPEEKLWPETTMPKKIAQ